MYAISLQGSKREYLAPFDRMFCKAPISTANIRGVVPNLNNILTAINSYNEVVESVEYFAVMGAKKAGNNINEKNAIPVDIERERYLSCE